MLNKLKSMLLFEKKPLEIAAPLDGEAIKLGEVNDPAFSEEMFGKGMAIKPTSSKVVSPVRGVVTQMFDTRHAVSITSDEGIEILIHVGLDTVKLKGEHFMSLAKNGDKVEVGSDLIQFDLEAIKAAGYDVVTPIVVCNSDMYEKFDIKTNISVKSGDKVISLERA